MRVPASLSRQREKACIVCGADISHRGNRAKRCGEHQAQHEAAQERDRYNESRDRISTRRHLHRAGGAEYEPTEPAVHGGDGRSRPPRISTTAEQAARVAAEESLPERRPAYRQNPRHDAATRMKLDYADESGAEQSSWDQITGMPKAGHYADFHPAQEAALPPADGWGRPYRQRAPRAEYVLDNPAALGAAFVSSSAAGHRVVQAQQHEGRFGPNVQPDRPHSGQYATAPGLQAQEQVAAEADQAHRQAIRSQVGYMLPGHR